MSAVALSKNESQHPGHERPKRSRGPGLAESIRASVWARSLTPEQLARVEETMVERALPAEGHVFHKGDPVDHWFGVIEGLLKLCAASPAGPVMLTGVPAGGWFGEGSVLRDRTWKYDAIAVRRSRVACMPRAIFQWLLDNSIPFNRFLLQQLNERLGQFIAIAEVDRVLDPDARVARCLASLFNPHLYPGIQQRLHLSQEETGHLSGVSRQRANQALHLLERAGILRVEYGRITVLDLEALRRFGAEDQG